MKLSIGDVFPHKDKLISVVQGNCNDCYGSDKSNCDDLPTCDTRFVTNQEKIIFKQIDFKIDVKFKPLFESDSPFIIIYGGVCTGKFYAGCQKLIIECLKRRISCVIFSGDINYCANIILEITIGQDVRYIKSRNGFDFPNGSWIDIFNHRNVFLQQSRPYYSYSLLKDPSMEVFDKLNRITLQQTIITCPPPEITSFIYDLSKKENCTKISSGSALDSPYLSDKQKEVIKSYYPT